MQNICYFTRPGRLNRPVLLCISVLIMPYRFAVFEQNIFNLLFLVVFTVISCNFFNRNKYLQDLYSNVFFLHCLSVVLHSRLGRYIPGGAHVGLCLLIAILFRCRSQKAKSFVSYPFSDLSSHYFAVTCWRSIPGEIKARPVPCNKFKFV